MKSRHLFAAAAVIGSSLSFANAQEAQVELTWQIWGGPEDVPLWQSIADLVNEEYPNITVTPKIAGWSDYWTRLPVLAASGEIGDIVTMQSMRMPSFYPVLEPLDSYIESNEFDLEPFQSSIINDLSVDGSQYALPYDVGPWIVFYNHDKFVEAGVPLPALDWTIDDFRETAKALTDDDSYGFAVQDFDFIAANVAMGADYLNDADEYDLTNEAFVSASSQLVDMVAVDGSSPVFSGAGAVNARGRFTSGNAAMYINGPWALLGTVDAVDFEIGVAPIPKGEGDPRYITAGSGFGVSAAGEHKEEAFLAVTVLTGPKAAEILGSAGRALSGRKAEQSFWYDVAAVDIVNARETLSYVFDHSTKFRLTDTWNEFENLLEQYLPIALNGDATTEQVLTDVQNLLP